MGQIGGTPKTYKGVKYVSARWRDDKWNVELTNTGKVRTTADKIYSSAGVIYAREGEIHISLPLGATCERIMVAGRRHINCWKAKEET